MRQPQNISSFLVPFFLIAFLISSTACSDNNSGSSNTTATTTVTPAPTQILTVIPRPQAILDLMKGRGDEDQAKPTLKIVSPAKDAIINGTTVAVKLELAGNLKGYVPHKDPATQKGNHIHVILDNQPYEAYFELGEPFELRNVMAGRHTLRVFPSRPWHESFKNEGAFQIVAFTVKGGGDAAKPTTTNSGQTVANDTASSAQANREGKDMANSSGGDVDAAKPLLTYSRPQGEYKGADGNPIMIDFWLSNAKLKGDGGDFLVRYIIDNDTPRLLDKWEPSWLAGWTEGKHTVRIELLGKDGWPVENGGYNTTSRDISVIK
jgi:hypothetical protein